jgi:hypothetical protein
VPPEQFRRVRLETIFGEQKWDPQVGDVSVLSPFALRLARKEWDRIARSAETMAHELLAVERELGERPDLRKRLGVERALRPFLAAPHAPGIGRVMRFDFHPTRSGWAVSEVNSDVPGGYVESSGFARLMAEQYSGFRTAGDPSKALATAIASALPLNGRVALVHATGWADDRQVMVHLARRFKDAGLTPLLASPNDIRWRAGRAFSGGDELAAIKRFFPAEWLPRLPRACGARSYFQGSVTPQCNPASALITQSKRLPLFAGALDYRPRAFLDLLPETVRSTAVPLRPDGEWVWKPVLGRVGDSVVVPGVIAEQEWRKLAKLIRRHPWAWIAQRRFESDPVDTPDGPHHLCVGVYVVDGEAVGLYGRLARRPLIDHHARDVALLIDTDEDCS